MERIEKVPDYSGNPGDLVREIKTGKLYVIRYQAGKRKEGNGPWVCMYKVCPILASGRPDMRKWNAKEFLMKRLTDDQIELIFKKFYNG